VQPPAGRTGAAPGAPIALESVANLRDVGGWRTGEGEVVRPGVLYRAAGLGRATDADVASLAGLGIGTVFDLRTAGERVAQPDRLPPSSSLVVADVLGDHLDSVPAHMFSLLADPVRATEELSGGRAEALLMQAYEQIVTLPSAHAAFASLYRHLAVSGPAVLVHCTTGKDRTGWAAAALLLLLGVPEEDVMAEYLLTNEQLLPALAPMFTAFAEAGGDPAVLLPVLGVRSEYLRLALDLVVAAHGSLDGYFRGALGLEEQVMTDLRSRLLLGASR
jgi:protein-tyrosine phosphatase